jgi:hypothetical protein
MSNFHWVPAAVHYRQLGGTGIFVRYAKNPNRIVIKEKGEGYHLIQCPDRDLLISINQNKFGAYRPMEGVWDEYIHLGMFHDHLIEDDAPNFFMVNYTADMGRESHSHNTRGEKKFATQIISDSGGFQLFQQRLEYLDPYEIVKWYNKNCDIGLVLDIPTRIKDISLYDRLAKVQAANTQVLMDNKCDNLELMNIIHGVTPEHRNIFRRRVERDDITRLALGGFYTGTVLNSIDNFCAELEASQPYKHYHVLGVANPMQVLLLQRMAHKNFAPLITCDSSTFLRKSTVKEYHLFPTTHGNPKFLTTGDVGGYVPSPMACLPCNCRVCSAVKYSDVLMSLSGNFAYVALMAYHNMYSMFRYYQTMSDLMRLPTPELKSLIKTQFSGSSRAGYDELIRGLDFIDMIEEEGLAKARKSFQYYLSNLMLGVSQQETRSTGQLFNEMGDVDNEVVSGADTIVHDDFATVDLVLTRYEQTNSNLHGKKTKVKAIRVGSNAAVGKKGPGVKIVKRQSVDEKHTAGGA